MTNYLANNQNIAKEQKMIKKIKISVFTLVLISALFNCSGSGTITQVKANTLKPTNTENLQVFLISTKLAGSSETQTALNLFESKLFEKLRTAVKTKFFKSDEKCSPACKYNIEIEFTKIVEVSAFNRQAIGAMAGRAKLEGVGRIIEIKSKAVVAEFNLEEVSSGGSAFAGTTRDVGDAAGTRVATYILQELGEQ